MNYRELFNEIMHYGSFDRMPVIHWDVWPETRERWAKEGFPPDHTAYGFPGAVPAWMPLINFGGDEDSDSWLSTGSIDDDINIGLFPTFQKEIFEDTEEYRVFRAGDGVILRAWKHQSSIPQYIDFTLKDARGWDEYKKRLQPDPARIARDIDKRHGVELYEVDSDGDLTALAGRWLDAGVDMLFPLEVGTFGGDARELRKKYGKELRLFGNFDKRVLAENHEAIQAEIERLLPLMKEGGYIVMPDHLIPPDVTLGDYRWYLDQIRELRL
jgi:hypothetical protein